MSGPRRRCSRTAAAKRLTDRALRGIVDRIARDASVEASLHTLRHTAATRWLQAGVDIVTVAELLGHAWLDTTRHCTQPNTNQLAAAVEAGAIGYWPAVHGGAGPCGPGRRCWSPTVVLRRPV